MVTADVGRAALAPAMECNIADTVEAQWLPGGGPFAEMIDVTQLKITTREKHECRPHGMC